MKWPYCSLYNNIYTTTSTLGTFKDVIPTEICELSVNEWLMVINLNVTVFSFY